jgi:hypothetical protein
LERFFPHNAFYTVYSGCDFVRNLTKMEHQENLVMTLLGFRNKKTLTMLAYSIL